MLVVDIIILDYFDQGSTLAMRATAWYPEYIVFENRTEEEELDIPLYSDPSTLSFNCCIS